MNISPIVDINDTKKLIKFCEKHGIKRVKLGDFEAEFFETKSEMKLDPLSLSKTLSDSMPPDSAMLFASSEDLPIEPNLNQSDGKQSDMA